MADEIEALVRAELKKRTGAQGKASAASGDDEDDIPAPEAPASKRSETISRAEAKAMLDITVDDDE